MASLSVGDPGSRGLPSDLSAAASQEPPAEPTTTLPATQEAAWHNRRNFGEQLTGKRSFKAVVNVMTDFPEAEEGKGFMMVANLTTGMTVSTPGRLPPHHRDPPHIPDFQFAPGVCSFCERCRTLMSKEGLLQASTESGYCHAKIDNWKRFLTERAEEKCALCKYIIAQWPVRRGWSKKEPTEILIYADFVDNALNGIQIFFKYDPDQGSEHEEMPHLLRPTEYYIRTIPGSDGIANRLCVGELPLTDLAGDKAFHAIRSLLRDCLEGHPSCIPKKAPVLPTHVISFDENESSGTTCIKLHRPSPGESADYVALSYCWGRTGQAMTLTSLTKDSLFNGVDISNLGATIKDAVWVTRRLGIPYLWVDSLCLFQDDKVAMRKEMDMMTEVYKNATIVLVAASAESVEEGFLHRRPAGDEICCLPLTLSNEPVNVHMFPRMVYDPTFQAPNHPLDSRAWTMQECALATRMLVFSEYEVFWHCAEASHRQLARSHLTIDTRGEYTPGDTFGVHMKFLRLRRALQQGGDTDWIQHWHQLVEEYTKRKISDFNDRLNALQGIVNEIINISGETYLHGAWSGSFIQCLAWRNLRPSESSCRSPRAPSWSWACLDQRIEMVGIRIPYGSFQYHIPSEPTLSEKDYSQASPSMLEIIIKIPKPAGEGLLELRSCYWGGVLLRGALMPESEGFDLGTYYPDLEGEIPTTANTFSLFLGIGGGNYVSNTPQAIFVRVAEVEDSNYKRLGLRILDTKHTEELIDIMKQWDLDSRMRFLWIV